MGPLNLVESSRRELGAIFVFFECSGYAANPKQYALADLRGGSIAAHCRHKSFRKGKNERDYALGDDRAVDFTLAPVGFTPRTNAPMNLPSTCGAMASTSIPSAERRSRAASAR